MTAHPSPFSATVLDAIEDITRTRLPRGSLVLDPFAGIGRIHKLGRDMGWTTAGVELEPEWASMSPGTVQGDATRLPWPADSFDAVITSPTYATRMADHHDAQERCKSCKGTGMIRQDDGKGIVGPCEKCGGIGTRTYKRNTYKHTLNRRTPEGKVADLHPRNSGGMQWGRAYRDLHEEAWAEATRVTRKWFVLNISDHIRKDVLVPVADWHLRTLANLGWMELDREQVDTPRNGFGQNRDARADFELVVLLEKL